LEERRRWRCWRSWCKGEFCLAPTRFGDGCPRGELLGCWSWFGGSFPRGRCVSGTGSRGDGLRFPRGRGLGAGVGGGQTAATMGSVKRTLFVGFGGLVAPLRAGAAVGGAAGAGASGFRFSRMSARPVRAPRLLSVRGARAEAGDGCCSACTMLVRAPRLARADPGDGCCSPCRMSCTAATMRSAEEATGILTCCGNQVTVSGVCSRSVSSRNGAASLARARTEERLLKPQQRLDDSGNPAGPCGLLHRWQQRRRRRLRRR
jgi:hypothetical protein